MTTPEGQSSQRIHVVAGALADPQGRVLIAKRLEGAPQGGLWEFPGGKLEPGEVPAEGLARELLEELGTRIRAWQPLIRIHHDYAARSILLDVYRIHAYVGAPAGLEGQALAWVAPETMDPALFPAADKPVITALRLPTRYLITGRDPHRVEAFLASLRRALAAGIRLVQLRAHELSDLAYIELARRAYPLCHAAGAKLILNRDPKLVEKLPCDGLHLSSARLRSLCERPCSASRLAGASCHDAEDLFLAKELDLDYALLAPVAPTPTHPNAAILGWRGFAELVEMACLPVYALGGLTSAHLDRSIENGGQGIAAIRSLWPSVPDNGLISKELP